MHLKDKNYDYNIYKPNGFSVGLQFGQNLMWGDRLVPNLRFGSSVSIVFVSCVCSMCFMSMAQPSVGVKIESCVANNTNFAFGQQEHCC